jgi:DNA-binding MarR family transcriptional regulator
MVPQPAAAPDPIAAELHRLAVATAALDSVIARRLGVSPTEYVALKHVMAEDGRIGPGRLARLLGMTPGSATVLVDRLEAAGHVRRVRHDADRRRVVLRTSAATERRVTRALAPLVAEVGELGAALDAAERAAVHRFLGALADRYAAHAEAGDPSRPARRPGA